MISLCSPSGKLCLRFQTKWFSLCGFFLFVLFIYYFISLIGYILDMSSWTCICCLVLVMDPLVLQPTVRDLAYSEDLHVRTSEDIECKLASELYWLISFREYQDRRSCIQGEEMGLINCELHIYECYNHGSA